MENFEDDADIKEEPIEKRINEKRKYLRIGGLMIALGTILAFVLYDWQLVIILFLIVQGNEIAQRSNDEITNILNEMNNIRIIFFDKINNKTDNYKE